MKEIRILVADDERIERSILCRKLSREFGDSCDFIQAENGREAIRLFQEQFPQIVILDIAMPGINGIEAAARIRELDKACVIVFLTAYSDFNYSVQAIRLRALDYLTKPYDDEELLAVIETAVYQVQARRKAEGGGLVKAGAGPGDGAAESGGGAAAGTGGASAGADSSADPQISQGTANQIQEFIQQNYMHDISMQDAARFLNYSDTYFCRLFKQGFGSNFTAYLTKYRIREAERLLNTTDLPVKEIGQRTGYQDANYFAKVFKRQTGVIPSEYRNEKREFYGR